MIVKKEGFIGLRLSEDDKIQLQQIANEQKISLSDLIRQTILNTK